MSPSVSRRVASLLALSFVYVVGPGCGGEPPRDAGADALVDAPRAPDADANANVDAGDPDGPLAPDVVAPGACAATGGVLCDGRCVDPQTDLQHCGACGRACGSADGATGRCVSGVCRLQCAAGHASCNGVDSDGCEADLSTSVAACGLCGLACPTTRSADPACVDGSCEARCHAGFADCDGVLESGCESSPDDDVEHCGDCGTRCPWPAHSSLRCASGACGFHCRAGYADCDGDAANGCEVSLTSGHHCGACGTVCAGATPLCASTGASSSCVSTCPAGTEACGGACVDTATSTETCGACGLACPGGLNAAPLCAAGQCVLECREGYADCDGDGANGCETNLRSSASHCGACGNRCASGPSATGICAAGACATRCNPGALDCDRSAANGCEVRPSDDVRNCGACGRACAGGPHARARCELGSCEFECQEGFGNCDGDASNGCETDLQASATSCGACGRACGPGQACVRGACAASACPAGRGDCDGNAGNGCETDLATAGSSCGFCGRACAGGACAGGSCATAACAAGRGDCDGDATNGCEQNTVDDAAHCGACGRRCAAANATVACASGACAVRECVAGFRDCDGDASNGCEAWVEGSTRNCGACGTRCSAGQVCSNGACIATVGRGSTEGFDAGGDEDAGFDGGGSDGGPAADGGMDAGAVDGSVTPDGGACPPGTVSCEGVCTRVTTDPANCGGCGVRCAGAPNAVAVCAAGVCSVNCVAGRGDCDGSAATGCETDLRGDAMHCGVCGRACPAGQLCNAGACSTQCDAPRVRCGTGASQVCVDPQTDEAHCGMCGIACPARANATARCASGACGVACSSGFANCDTMDANGCEADLNTSLAHCGMCGRACTFANASAMCATGTCALGMCTSGHGNCDGMAANGCETDTSTSTDHCGMCGRVCSFANAAATCSAGGCQLGACMGGSGNCDGNDANGCETNTATSVAHCGMCGRACSYPNAAATCAGGMCSLGACSAGFGNCDGNNANGCETNTNTSSAHCGACGNACTGGRTCVSGACQCPTGQMFCGGACVDPSSSSAHCGACGNACTGGMFCNAGFCAPMCSMPNTLCGPGGSQVCVSLQSNTSNCGSCGNVCPTPANASATCSSGGCGLSCNGGYGNCDGNSGNGCETNTTNNASHCGACGNGCSFSNAGASCSGSACVLGACNGGFGNCDGNNGNGCETNTTNNNSHCGACGNACTGGRTCQSGSCACPGGTTLCGGSCVTVGQACTWDHPQCASAGITACVSGFVQCTPSGTIAPSGTTCHSVGITGYRCDGAGTCTCLATECCGEYCRSTCSGFICP